ncbi:hypothetical protein CI109_104250 [Kwoniella shandongensis]|uniref:Uncharacterized protein n=1 Tax=Kwoniella shandongensis TaxID=1734106 RepID=A0A5M6C0M6_9TREE|nr:uncharacterized protein CI109_002844 [Kwoniella shandongensis]KAA5528686.1 hypothetical protein CI109_002844 [Kwoniella shandongensis]
MSSTSSEPHVKDRKRSAHWTDSDTETLVNLLLRYKDSGRTADNGFKPEVWREAAGLLEGSTYMGGPKTPDACKSRWQRLQRDYRAAKDMEAMPGFTWDRNTHRLSASPKAWENAESQLDSYKYRKIHLPCFDSLAILCASEGPRSRPRQPKGRTSLASVSDTSSLLNLSVSSAGPGGNGVHSHNHAHSHTMGNGHGHGGIAHHHSMNHGNGNGNGHVPHGQHDSNANANVNALAQLQGQLQQDHGVFNWGGEGGDEDGEGEFDSSFALSDGAFNIGQKRPMPFDPSLLSGPSQSHTQSLQIPPTSPPKKPRSSNSLPSRQPSMTQLSQNHHQQPQQHQHQQTNQPPFHYTLPSAPAHHHPSRSPDFSTSTPNTTNANNGNGNNNNNNTSTNLIDPHVLQTPPGMLKPFIHTPTSTPGPVSNILSAEVSQAGLSEAQRRTEAILQLQSKEVDMRDEDLVEIMAEFESNVAAADTYLAIRKEGLRRLWLASVVKRRKR